MIAYQQGGALARHVAGANVPDFEHQHGGPPADNSAGTVKESYVIHKWSVYGIWFMVQVFIKRMSAWEVINTQEHDLSGL
ncbi:MAG: hypothetical protein JSV03_09585 [Planctomycetota bacterium]|nr:MAG: hypothetical protein JSV03_09585 [Planctomycetota bacterium]